MEFHLSDDLDQVPFGAAEFADNPEPRCPVVVVIDTSGSMAGEPIAELAAGIAQLQRDLADDALAAKRIELALVTFGPNVRVAQDFGPIESFGPGHLVANGQTPMGEAIVRSLELVRRRKGQYRESGIAYFRPWVLILTDGAPTDDWARAAEAVRVGEDAKAFSFYAVGVGDADMATLARIAVRTPLRLRGLAFRDLFAWLSSSLSAISRSQPGVRVLLPPPGGPSGWASTD